MPTADAPRPSDGVPAFDGAVSSSAGPGLMNGVIENALLEALRAGHEWAFEMMVRPIRRAPPRGCTTANTQRRRHVRRGPIGVPERLPRAEGVRGRLPTIGLAAPNRGQHSPHETAVAAAKARGSDRGNLVGCQTSNRQTCCNPFSERAPDAANAHERFVACSLAHRPAGVYRRSVPNRRLVWQRWEITCRSKREYFRGDPAFGDRKQ